MENNRQNDFDDEDIQLVRDFEKTVLQGGQQFFDIDELEVIMDYYLETNDLKPLQRAVEYAEDLYPDSTSVRLRRAHLLIAHGQYKQALRIVRQLRTENSDDTDVAYSLGVVYGALGEHEKAIGFFHEAAVDGWMLGRIYANIAEEYYALHNYDEAIRFCQLALDTDSYDDATLYNYLDTAFMADRLDEAAAYLKSFVEEHPYSNEGWHILGNAYRYMGRMEQAVDAYEYANAADSKNYAVYCDQAIAYELMDKPGEAVSILLRARDVAPGRETVYMRIAEIYGRTGDADMAILYLRKALEENPDSTSCLAMLAVAYIVIGESSLALPLLKKARTLAPDDVEVLSAQAVYYDSVDNFEAASDCYDRILTSEDCTEAMCQRYVHFLYRHKEYELLIDFGEESLGVYPDDPYYCTYLAAAYFHTNRYNRASRVLPHADAWLLHEICPELCNHPRLGPLVPPLYGDADPSSTV